MDKSNIILFGMVKKKLIFLYLIFIIIPLIQGDLVNFNYGGDNGVCINNGLDSCNLDYIPKTSNPIIPPPTSSITYINETNITIPENITEQKNETIVKDIEEIGKNFNYWIFILAGLILFLILISSVLLDISKKKLSKDGITFIITCLMFAVITLIFSIYYKSFYSLGFLIIIVLIFMIISMMTIFTKDNIKNLEIFGIMSICLISLIFSIAMLLVKNYIALIITMIITVTMIIISISILIDSGRKR